MMTALKKPAPSSSSIRVDVVETGARVPRSSLACVIDENLNFSTESLESYFFADWDPAVYDALVVAAAVEYCDKTQRRSAYSWGREIELSIPVHDPHRWNHKDVSGALHETLDFLTGDRWQLIFRPRKRPLNSIQQGQFRLSADASAVIPFSDGLDSRAVAALTAQQLGDRLVRIHLGRAASHPREPFTAVPYRVRGKKHDFVESSARSRGFKFALVAGIAAYFAKAGQIIVPESGQGALGPALLVVGQSYPDYRSHPRFTNRMEQFLAALLGLRVSFQFPQLWQTKGETLARFMKECPDTASCAGTWSCWQDSRQVSVAGKKRQCGICAACMLRRLSLHAAGVTEPKATYVWEDLSAVTFEKGAAAGFKRKRITPAMHEYAIAGTLHLDHMAALLHSPARAQTLSLNTAHLGQACKLDVADVRTRLHRLLTQHETEWKAFVRSLVPNSFVAKWAVQGR